MGRAARPLHDTGNHRSIERGSDLQSARRGSLSHRQTRWRAPSSTPLLHHNAGHDPDNCLETGAIAVPISLRYWWLFWIRINKHALRRIGFRGPKPRIEAEQRSAIGAENRVLLAHVDVDVRVIVRRRNADTVEFPDANSDLRDRVVVPELRIAAAGHRFRPS